LLNTVLIISKSIDDNSDNDIIYSTTDEYFLYFYTFEMFVKILSYGIVLNTNGYLRDSWNVLDFFIIVSGWISKFISIYK